MNKPSKQQSSTIRTWLIPIVGCLIAALLLIGGIFLLANNDMQQFNATSHPHAQIRLTSVNLSLQHLIEFHYECIAPYPAHTPEEGRYYVISQHWFLNPWRSHGNDFYF